MRICLDGRNLLLSQPTGVGSYAAGVAATLRGLGHDVEVLAQDPGGRSPWLRALQPWAAHCPAPQAGLRHLPDAFRAAHLHFSVFGRPLRLTGPAPDLMHWTYPLPLHWPGVPNIYTVHDLIPLLHPALTGVDGRRMRRILAAVIARADHILTVSESTRAEIIAQFACDPARVTNTGQALDLPSPADTSPVSAEPYYLYVGSVEPRKNIRRLLQAHRASGVATPLVIAGPDGWHAAEEVAGLLPAPNVRRLGWQPRPVLVRLLMEARALLFPSLAEGFGLPVAEAMALGTPVLTSHNGALAEIAGGAALLVDPTDVAAIAGGMARLDADPTLRAGMAARGRAVTAARATGGLGEVVSQVMLRGGS